MVLSADPTFKFTEGSPNEGLKEAESSKALAIGSVVVRPGSPIRFLAIIHDLSKHPTWTEKPIQQALCNVFREAEKRKLRSIAVRALGSQHGSVDEDRFVELFNAVLAETNLKSVKRIWIVLPIRRSNLLVVRSRWTHSVMLSIRERERLIEPNQQVETLKSESASTFCSSQQLRQTLTAVTALWGTFLPCRQLFSNRLRRVPDGASAVHDGGAPESFWLIQPLRRGSRTMFTDLCVSR
jgi:hypothetical protein